MLNFNVKGIFKNKPLLVILLLAFIVRLILMCAIFVKNPDGIYLHDSYGYWNLGYNITNNGVFSQSEDFPLEPDYYRTPIYPLFIAFSELIGPEGFTIIFLQICLAVLTCYFVYRIANLITGNTFIANTAAFIVAIDLPSIALSNLVLTETLFTFLLLVSIYFFIRFYKNTKTSDLIYAGLFSGLTILCRPIAFFIPFLFSLFIIIKLFPSIKKGLKQTIVFSTIVLLTLSPWFVRNKVVFGHYFLSVIREHNMLNYQAGTVYAKQFNYPLPKAQSMLRWKTFNEFNAQHGNANEHPYEYAKYIEKEAWNIIFDNPVIFLKEQTKQVVYFFLRPARALFEIQLGHWGKGYNTIPRSDNLVDDLFQGTSKITIALVFFQFLVMLIVYGALIWGFIYMRKINQILPFVLFVTIILCFAMLNLPPITEARFRVPAWPVIAIISACGIYYLKEKVQHRLHNKGTTDYTD